ncbi:hypothetical protein ABLE94_19240 [Gordonia sp. VNK1]|uniref:hypothetical protein n=1 Tax=Gordonia oleivorans TaxID=3156618 RepID=UPI0032B4DD3D
MSDGRATQPGIRQQIPQQLVGTLTRESVRMGGREDLSDRWSIGGLAKLPKRSRLVDPGVREISKNSAELVARYVVGSRIATGHRASSFVRAHPHFRRAHRDGSVGWRHRYKVKPPSRALVNFASKLYEMSKL